MMRVQQMKLGWGGLREPRGRQSASVEPPMRRDPGRTASLATLVAFVLLFQQPFVSLVRDWWELPEAGHGLLLAPMAVWLAWRDGIRTDAMPNRMAGIAILVLPCCCDSLRDWPPSCSLCARRW